MREGQAHDLEDAHEDLCEEEEVVEYRKCRVDFCVTTSWTSCLQLIDLDIFGAFAAKATAAKESQGLMRDPSRETCA